MLVTYHCNFIEVLTKSCVMYSPDIHSALSICKHKQSITQGGFTQSVCIKTTALEHPNVFTVNTHTWISVV